MATYSYTYSTAQTLSLLLATPFSPCVSFPLVLGWSAQVSLQLRDKHKRKPVQYRTINLEGGRRALVKMKTPQKDHLFDVMATMDEGDDEDTGAAGSGGDDITTGGACVTAVQRLFQRRAAATQAHRDAKDKHDLADAARLAVATLDREANEAKEAYITNMCSGGRNMEWGDAESKANEYLTEMTSDKKPPGAVLKYLEPWRKARIADKRVLALEAEAAEKEREAAALDVQVLLESKAKKANGSGHPDHGNIRGSTDYDDKDTETTQQRDRRLTETKVHIKGSQRAADSVGRFLSQRELQEAELQLADEIMHYHEAYTARYTKARSAYLWKKSERAQSRTEKREKGARYQRELVDKRAQFKLEKQQVLQRLEQLRRRSKLTHHGGKKGKPRVPRAFVSVGLAAEGDEGGGGGGGGQADDHHVDHEGRQKHSSSGKKGGESRIRSILEYRSTMETGGLSVDRVSSTSREYTERLRMHGGGDWAMDSRGHAIPADRLEWATIQLQRVFRGHVDRVYAWARWYLKESRPAVFREFAEKEEHDRVSRNKSGLSEQQFIAIAKNLNRPMPVSLPALRTQLKRYGIMYSRSDNRADVLARQKSRRRLGGGGNKGKHVEEKVVDFENFCRWWDDERVLDGHTRLDRIHLGRVARYFYILADNRVRAEWHNENERRRIADREETRKTMLADQRGLGASKSRSKGAADHGGHREKHKHTHGRGRKRSASGDGGGDADSDGIALSQWETSDYKPTKENGGDTAGGGGADQRAAEFLRKHAAERNNLKELANQEANQYLSERRRRRLAKNGKAGGGGGAAESIKNRISGFHARGGASGGGGGGARGGKKIVVPGHGDAVTRDEQLVHRAAVRTDVVAALSASRSVIRDVRKGGGRIKGKQTKTKQKDLIESANAAKGNAERAKIASKVPEWQERQLAYERCIKRSKRLAGALKEGRKQLRGATELITRKTNQELCAVLNTLRDPVDALNSSATNAGRHRTGDDDEDAFGASSLLSQQLAAQFHNQTGSDPVVVDKHAAKPRDKYDHSTYGYGQETEYVRDVEWKRGTSWTKVRQHVQLWCARTVIPMVFLRCQMYRIPCQR